MSEDLITVVDADQLALQYEIEQFYFYEAELLDEWKWRTWYELFTDDTRYWMPVRKNKLRRDRDDFELPTGIDMAHFDESKSTLDLRVRQLESGTHWAEDPPSRSRHLITNVRIKEVPENRDDGAYLVRTNFLCYRNRLEKEVDIWAGQREDVLRRTDASFSIASRTILLDQNVVLSKNLSVFF